MFLSEVYIRGSLGTTRVRKGMPGSLPSGLLTPTLHYRNILRIHKEICVTGVELKRLIDQNSLRLRTILFANKGNN